MWVDYHHLVEDIGIVLEAPLRKRWVIAKGSIAMAFGCPMDEAQAQAEVCLDLSGRPFFVYIFEHEQKYIRDFDVTIMKHF